MKKCGTYRRVPIFQYHAVYSLYVAIQFRKEIEMKYKNS